MDSTMKISVFYKSIILFTLLWTHFALAQTGKVLIVNSDNAVFRYEAIAAEFKKNLQLNDYQWTEITIEKNAVADDVLNQLIQEDKHGLIYCLGSEAFSLVDKYAHNKKILFSGIINWQRMKIGEKTNGIANELSANHEMSLQHFFFPMFKNIGVIYSEAFSHEYIENLKKAAVSNGINLISVPDIAEDELSNELQELMPKIDMFWLISDPNVLNSKESVQQIFAAAKQYKKPVYAYSDVYIAQGALLSISIEPITIARQAAGLAIKMDTDDKTPGGVVQYPAGSLITLNKCVLDELKLKFNPDGLNSVYTIKGCKK